MSTPAAAAVAMATREAGLRFVSGGGAVVTTVIDGADIGDRDKFWGSGVREEAEAGGTELSSREVTEMVEEGRLTGLGEPCTVVRVLAVVHVFFKVVGTGEVGCDVVTSPPVLVVLASGGSSFEIPAGRLHTGEGRVAGDSVVKDTGGAVGKGYGQEPDGLSGDKPG
ncbi:hypothetical protein HDU93_000082 [Gonapodya sp. JEL0774]|nr:hypothetical protein HDU93_000082 [Gonapodya sp. JEL0774]